MSRTSVGSLDEAIAVLERAAAIQRTCAQNTRSHKYNVTLGELYERKGRFEDALAAYQTSLETLEPGSE